MATPELKGQPKFRKKRISWEELSAILSKAGVLMPDEEIDNLTLVKPRALLLYTSRPTS